MTFAEIGEFLWRLFFTGLSEVTVGAFLLNVFLMSVLCAGVVFLLTVILLSSPIYRSEGIRPLVDADGRVKLCAAWATMALFLVLLFVLFWIWYRALIPMPHDFSFWVYQRPLVAHWTVLVLLFVTWVLLYRGARGDIRRAQMTIPLG